MRVLHVINNRLESRGNGTVDAAVDLACTQALEGCEVYVASSGGEYETLLERCGARHLYLGGTRGLREFPGTCLRYLYVVRESRPDVVHTHTRLGTTIGGLLRRPGYGLPGRGLSGYGLVTTIHNTRWQGPLLPRLSDRVVAVSDSAARFMAQSGVPEKRLRVVHNGALGSPRSALPQEVEPEPLAHPAVVTVAGMYHHKGIGTLISAFERVAAELPGAHLYLIGDGPDRPEFELQAGRTAAAPRIHFTGFQRMPQRYMKAADVFVLASTRESFGLVVTEAREAGCAVVATETGGIPEALDGGAAGLLVPPEKPGTLADALLRVLSDPGERSRLRAAAGRNLDRYTATRVAGEYREIYRELLGELAGS